MLSMLLALGASWLGSALALARAQVNVMETAEAASKATTAAAALVSLAQAQVNVTEMAEAASKATPAALGLLAQVQVNVMETVEVASKAGAVAVVSVEGLDLTWVLEWVLE